jgi:hypothetical protein
LTFADRPLLDRQIPRCRSGRDQLSSVHGMRP